MSPQIINRLDKMVTTDIIKTTKMMMSILITTKAKEGEHLKFKQNTIKIRLVSSMKF